MRVRGRGGVLRLFPALWLFRRAVAWSVVLTMLLIAVVTQVAMAPSADAKPKGKDPRTIPLMVSAAKGKPIKEPPQPEADFTPLLADGGKPVTPGKSAFDPKTSKESGRTETSIEFLNANGSKTLVLSKEPVSVPDGKGGWDPLDTRLVERKDSKKAVPARAGIGVELAEFANDPALFKVNQGGVPVTIELKGAGKAGRKIEGSTATYANALPNTDVTYEVTPSSVKESIILKSAAAVGEGKWNFVLKTGELTPQVDGKVVKISDKSGKVVAVLPAIEVWDSAGSEKDKKPSARTGGTYTLVRDGENWRLTVTVEKKWLSDKARKFPITVDPTYTFNTPTDYQTYMNGSLSCTAASEEGCGVMTGNNRGLNGVNNYYRSTLRYHLDALAGKTVTAARMDLRLGATNYPDYKTPSLITLNQATTPVTANGVGAELATVTMGETASLSSPALIALLDERTKTADKNAWLMLRGTETNTYSYKYLLPTLVVDYTDGGPTPPPSGPTVGALAPVEDAIISTDVPTLEVSPAAAGTKYCFKISTGFDGRSGSVVDSGCLTDPRWTVPKDVLTDGARYSWTVGTVEAGGSIPYAQNWVGHFTVNRRIGSPGPAPTDSFGPVTVNLFNGNLQTTAAGPKFEALGGSAGVTFAYNSRGGGDSHGVRATYFNDLDHNGVADTNPVMVRNEAQINLDYGNLWTNVGSNSPFQPDPTPSGLDRQWHVIRWEGYFVPAVTGDFSFAGAHADGAKIWVDNKLTYDNPNAAEVNSTFNTAWAKKPTDISLTAGKRVPIKVEMVHRTTAKPKMILWAKSTTGTISRSHNWNPRIVTTEFLFAQDPAPLSRGWTLGLMGSKYVQAEMLDGAVVLTDASGGKHGWSKLSMGGYAPPAGEDGVLAVDAGGRVSVTVDGTVSVFNVDGTLAAVSTVADSKKPASLQYLYSGSPARLTQIKDPVSGRSHTLHYNTDGTNNCYGGASPPTGASVPPAHKLCRIKYWDGTETRLWYATAFLARIENPGSEIRDYSHPDVEAILNNWNNGAYSEETKLRTIDSIGPISEIRDSLAVDLRAAGLIPANYADRTSIEYEGYSDDPANRPPHHTRARLVTGPAADGTTGNARPHRMYDYRIFEKKAWLVPRGIDVATRTFTWDDAGRQLTEINAVGDVHRSEWNSEDKLTAQIDPAGHRSTVVYDQADRPVDEFGPAPSDCFNGQLPKPECSSTMPHRRFGYDENLRGLESAFYDNPYLAGVPKEWSTGVGAPDGALSRNWGADPPVANTGGWSGRFTGEIVLPTTGEHKLGFTVVDGVRLWIDERLVVDSWTDKPATAVTGTYTNQVAGSRHKVRVDYYNRAGNTGGLDFVWTPPGSGGPVTVPGDNLAPRYGLETSTVNYNTSGGSTERAPSRQELTEFADQTNGIDPVFGLAATHTVDPGGANLTTRSLFESPGQGFMRQRASALPGGDITNTDRRDSSTYYGDTETRANPCDTGSAAVYQGGRAKTVRGAKNSDGTAQVVETVYDVVGRVVASRTNAEPWSCETYDSRGRTTKKSFPAMAGKPARTINTAYAYNGDPRITRVSDESGSVTTTVDLHARTVNYTDANGVATVTQYDIAGRKTSEATTIKDATSTLNFQWDNAYRLARIDLDGTAVATPAYQAGAMAGAAYGNGSTLTIGRNDAGTTSSLAWKVAGATVTDTVVRSKDQRIIDETVTDTANPGSNFNSAYTYDGVGRLVAATVPFHQLTYSFGSEGGCGPNTKAGNNTNRTSATDSFNGAPAVTTNYCYDDADRLLSTNGGLNLSLNYDTYGNATRVGTDTLGYDSTRRHVSSATTAGNWVTYTRDVRDRITIRDTQRIVNGSPMLSKTRYGFTSDTSGQDFILDSTGGLIQRVLKLPGGVVYTKDYRANKPQNWAYPNVHGDILLTTDAAAARTGTLRLYDPFGQNIDPSSGVIGDIPIPATVDGGMDFGWLGENTVPVEHIASQQALEMGARTYLPILGRFLQTDPVAGGSANDYDYANADPVNTFDLTGEFADDILEITAPDLIAAVIAAIDAMFGTPPGETQIPEPAKAAVPEPISPKTSQLESQGQNNPRAEVITACERCEDGDGMWLNENTGALHCTSCMLIYIDGIWGNGMDKGLRGYSGGL